MSIERFTLYGNKLEHGTALCCSVLEHKVLPNSLFHSVFFANQSYLLHHG